MQGQHLLREPREMETGSGFLGILGHVSAMPRVIRYFLYQTIYCVIFIGSHFNHEIKRKYLLHDLGKLIPKGEALSSARRGMGVEKAWW